MFKCVKFFKIIFLLLSQIVFAQTELQDLSFQYLTINEGLSQNTVLAIAQDSTGYIWFGTRDGLNRYDGYTFKQYFSDYSDINSLSSNEITALDVTPNGIIWIGTNNGLNSFNPETEKFTNYFHNPSDKYSIVDNYVNVIVHNSKGEIFIGTDKGLSILSANNSFTSYQTDVIDGIKKNQLISSIVLDSDENLWVGGPHSLARFDREKNEFQKIKLFNDVSLDEEPLAVQGLLFNTGTELWVGTRFGLIRYDIKSRKIIENLQNEIEFNPLIRQYLRNLFKDTNGNIWFAEWSGLRIFDKNSEEFVSYGKSKKEGSLNSSAINAILEDKSGVIWIGTSFGGVNYFDPTKRKFTTLNQETGLSNDIVSSIAEDNDGNFWIGTIGGGLNRIDKMSGEIEIISDENSKLVNNLIRVITINGEDLWIGDWGNNLTHLSLPSHKMHVISLADLGFSLHPSNAIKDIEIDADKNIWVATSRNGIFKINQKGDAENFVSNSTNCFDNRVREIFFDRNNTMWVISDKGLSKYIDARNSFQCLDFGNDDCMTRTKMISVYVDEKNIFWIGTYGSGLLRIDIEKEECINYRANKSIPNNVVYGILPDSSGNLWLSTNNGIAKFNPKTAKSNNFNIKDGLQSNEFNDNAFYKADDGRLLFGGIAGLNIISPSTISINEYIPPIVITDIEFLNPSNVGDNYLDRLDDNTLTLHYNQTDFHIEFSALNFSQSLKNKYAYKLEPSNKEWISLENRRSITFTNLKYGKYVLKIKGSNNDGIWNEMGTELKIVVLPPFWLSWWFLAILFLFVVGILSLISYLKMRSLIKVERLRTKIASDLHDDVGASLTKISMNASLLNYETEPNGIKRRVESLNNLSQEVISMMSDIVWSIDARNDSMQDLIDRMKNFAFNHVSEKEIDVNFKSDCSNIDEKLKINIRQNFYLIFKEAFHNAVKYSDTERIDVTIKVCRGGLKFVLVDNGIGLESKTNNLGTGLRNMKMRAKRIKANLELINENGLTVSLTLTKI